MAAIPAPGISVRQPQERQAPGVAGTGSVQTYFLADPQQSGSSAGLLTSSLPTAVTSATGWTVGTVAANNYSRQTYNTENATTTFGVTPQPANPPATAGGHIAEDCWRLSAATSGVFFAGVWYSSLSVLAVTNATVQAGQARFRIWRSTDPGGAGAIEVTDPSRILVGTITPALSTTVATSSVASVALPTVVLNNEFLFLQVAWQIMTAGTNAGSDCLIRYGSMSPTDGSGLVTSAFSGTVAAVGGGAARGAGFHGHRKHWSAA